MEARSHRALGAPGAQVALALATLYVVWGSTYLAIRVAVGPSLRSPRALSAS